MQRHLLLLLLILLSACTGAGHIGETEEKFCIKNKINANIRYTTIGSKMSVTCTKRGDSNFIYAFPNGDTTFISHNIDNKKNILAIKNHHQVLSISCYPVGDTLFAYGWDGNDGFSNYVGKKHDTTNYGILDKKKNLVHYIFIKGVCKHITIDYAREGEPRYL